MKTFNLSLAAIAAMSIVSTTNASSLEEALKKMEKSVELFKLIIFLEI